VCSFLYPFRFLPDNPAIESICVKLAENELGASDSLFPAVLHDSRFFNNIPLSGKYQIKHLFFVCYVCRRKNISLTFIICVYRDMLLAISDKNISNFFTGMVKV